MVKNTSLKKRVGKNGIGIEKFGIGINKFDVELELTKWNWVELELKKKMELIPCLGLTNEVYSLVKDSSSRYVYDRLIISRILLTDYLKFSGI